MTKKQYYIGAGILAFYGIIVISFGVYTCFLASLSSSSKKMETSLKDFPVESVYFTSSKEDNIVKANFKIKEGVDVNDINLNVVFLEKIPITISMDGNRIQYHFKDAVLEPPKILIEKRNTGHFLVYKFYLCEKPENTLVLRYLNFNGDHKDVREVVFPGFGAEI